MKFRNVVLRVGITSLYVVMLLLPAAEAGATGMPQLVISQFKITSSGGQFVTLYNQSDAVLNLSQYEIDYINSSGKLAGLPIAGQLAPRSFYMLSDDQIRLCYQMTVNAASLGFSTTGGSLEVWQVADDGSSKLLQDKVAWTSKTKSTDPVSLPAQNSSSTVSLLREPTNSLGSPQVPSAGSGTWQAVTPDAVDPCMLDFAGTTTTVASPVDDPADQLSVGAEPPATIMGLAADMPAAGAPHLPAVDAGLAAPRITELLPNPAGSGTDGANEFVELYNPNPVPFDLSGFVLQVGLTAKHRYTLPDGTLLPAEGFVAFYSADTGLSLSNTGGQAGLLDPSGNVVSQSDQYGNAKDGAAWVLAQGKWYWTNKPTPGAANVVIQTAGAKAAKKKASTGVKGASATSTLQGDAAAGAANDTGAPAPIHPLILAAVAVLAIGYGVYEYRNDLGNKLHQFRANRAARRKARG